MKYKSLSIKPQPDGSVKVAIGKKSMGVISGASFQKEVRGSRHLFRFVPGWALDVDVLELLKKEGVKTIQIIDIETDKVYKASLGVFLDKGVRINFPKYGSQLCLPLADWKVNSYIRVLSL